jgi:hypothetical protein
MRLAKYIFARDQIYVYRYRAEDVDGGDEDADRVNKVSHIALMTYNELTSYSAKSLKTGRAFANM